MILDSATPMLTEMRMVSHDYAMDALNYASVKLQKSMQTKARSYGRSKFGNDFSSGKRLLAGSNKNVNKGKHFSRFSKSDGEEKHDMANFIKFQVSDIYLKSRIGFIDVKGFQAQMYRDGKKTTKKHVKGQGGVNAIGKTLEYGGKQILTNAQKNLFKRSGWGKAASRGYIQRKARPVINPAFNSMQGEILGMFNRKYGEALSKHASSMNLQPRKIS